MEVRKHGRDKGDENCLVKVTLQPPLLINAQMKKVERKWCN